MRSDRDIWRRGQEYLEDRALPGLASDVDESAVALDDFQDGGRRDSGAANRTLGREEGLEDARTQASGIAQPVSGIRMRTKAPLAAIEYRVSVCESRETFSASIVMRPPSDIASRAFTHRLSRTW